MSDRFLDSVASIENNIHGAKFSSKADLRNKKGKFASVKNVTKSACSTDKLNHARKMAKNDVLKMMLRPMRSMKLFPAK